MEGLREQRSNSGNDQRDHLLDSLHECDTYKKLSKKRRDPEDITSFEQIESKKSSINDIPNFYSRLEEGFEYPESLINGFTRELTEKYDELMGNAFLAYGMDRKFILNHRYDIRYTLMQNRDDNYENIVVELVSLPIKLFTIYRDYNFRHLPKNSFNHSDIISIEGHLQLFMEHEGTELEEIKQYIQHYYKEKEN